MRNPEVDARCAHLVQTGLFVVAAGGLIASSIIALLTKENPNWKVPAIWGLLAIVAGGGADLLSGPNARLGEQVSFLTTENGRWEELQRTYGLRGPDWARFARIVVQEETGKAALIGARRPGVTLTDDERKTVIALAPAAIKPKVRLMLQSSTS